MSLFVSHDQEFNQNHDQDAPFGVSQFDKSFWITSLSEFDGLFLLEFFQFVYLSSHHFGNQSLSSSDQSCQSIFVISCQLFVQSKWYGSGQS